MSSVDSFVCLLGTVALCMVDEVKLIALGADLFVRVFVSDRVKY